MSRLGVSILTLSLLAGCAELSQLESQLKGPTAPLAPRVYVANERSESVTVIDAQTYTVLTTVDSKNPSTHDLALSRDGTRLYATNLDSGRLAVIDTHTLETIASIYTGSRCHGVALTHDGRFAWVANTGEDTVSIVDTATYRIVGSIVVGKGPSGVAFSRDGAFAYVSNQGDKTVAVVDTASFRIIKTLPVGANPHFLVLGPDGRIWGTNSGGNDIFVIDPATQSKVASIEVGPNPQQIAFAYKGTIGPNAYVSLSGANQVAVVRAQSINPLRLLERIQVGERPNGIAANTDGTRIFVGHETANDLRIYDTTTHALIATMPVGRKPVRVVLSR